MNFIKKVYHFTDDVGTKKTQQRRHPHPTLLQAEEKRACNPVPKCPSKLLELAIGQSAG